jgi:hypothetical protein
MFIFAGEFRNANQTDEGEQQTRPGYRFGMVHPTPCGQPITPYVYRDEDEARQMWRLTEHHSHLYKVSDDLTAVKLVEKSGCIPVGAPAFLALNEENQTRLRRAIADMG